MYIFICSVEGGHGNPMSKRDDCKLSNLRQNRATWQNIVTYDVNYSLYAGKK